MTPQQSKLYHWLLDRIDDPVCPTFEEMRVAMGLGSKSGVHRIIDALVSDGLVVRGGANRVRSVRAVRTRPLDGISTTALVDELKRRGEWPYV